MSCICGKNGSKLTETLLMCSKKCPPSAIMDESATRHCPDCFVVRLLLGFRSHRQYLWLGFIVHNQISARSQVRKQMIRQSLFALGHALQTSIKDVFLTKDYKKVSELRKKDASGYDRTAQLQDFPLRYQLLECPPGLPLAITKLKFLLACRRTHPAIGGNAEDFLRINLAYQDVLKDYGVEMVDGKVVNFGNFQSDDHEAKNYLHAHSTVVPLISVSTLEKHIKDIESIHARLGHDIANKLSINGDSDDDETRWLLEDIEDMMETTGLGTVKLQVSYDNTKVLPIKNWQLTEGTERPLFLENKSEGPTISQTLEPAAGSATVENSTTGNCSREGDDGDGKTKKDHSIQNDFHVVEVSASDINTLNLKKNLQDCADIAGMASRTATEVMNNTNEMKQIKLEASVLYVIVACLIIAAFVTLDTLFRARRQTISNSEVERHVMADTMLPWWGNDIEYENQVKRIFIEEWRHARASSRRAQTIQDGIAHESVDDKTKREADLQIFTVTAERLRQMREDAQRLSSALK